MWVSRSANVAVDKIFYILPFSCLSSVFQTVLFIVRVEQEATLRFAILSLRAFVKYNWMRATNNVQQVLGVVARLVRRLMRQDLPTNVMLDCGVIVFEIDSRRNGLTSSLWVSEISP